MSARTRLFGVYAKNKGIDGVKKWLEEWMTEFAALFVERQTDRFEN